MMKTKEIVFTAPRVARLLDAEVPDPGPGEVTVRLDYSAISAGTEKANFIGQRNTIFLDEDSEPVFPRAIGYSAAGVVTAVGGGVSSVAVGDRVVRFGGTHKKLCTVPADRVVKIPGGVGEREAAFAYIATFPLAAIRKTRLELGEPVLVMGLGILGITAVELARAAGAYPVLAADPLPSRRDMALRLGADAAFDPLMSDFADRVKAASGGGVKVCVEVTGLGAGLQEALDCMRPLGRVALLGCTRSSKFEIDYYKKVHGPGISLIGAHTNARPRAESSPGLWTERDDLVAVLDLLAGGRLNFRDMVSEVHSPAEAQEVYTRVADERDFPVGVLFDWSGVE